MSAPVCQPPTISVVIELESKVPRLRKCYAHEADHERMCLWLERNPELLHLILDAMQIAEEAEAA